MMTNEVEFKEIKEFALDVATNISNGTKYPINQIMDLAKRLSAYALRLRIMAGEMERNEATKAKDAARGLDNLVSVLKYEIKEHIEKEYWGRNNVS